MKKKKIAIAYRKGVTFEMQEDRYSARFYFDADYNDENTIGVFLIFSLAYGDPCHGIIEYGRYQTMKEAENAKDNLATLFDALLPKDDFTTILNILFPKKTVTTLLNTLLLNVGNAEQKDILFPNKES